MIKENTEINSDIKKIFDTHSETYIINKILVKKHKLKVSTAYLYFKNYKEKYGQRES